MSEAVSKEDRDNAYTLDKKRADAQDAFNNASRYHAEVRDIYSYFMPFREPTSERSNQGGASEGAKRTQKIYDGTGPAAAFAYIANMQADWLPMFEDIYTLESGPLWPGDGDEVSERNTNLQKIATVTNALLGPVKMTGNEMFADHFAGTGAILVTKGSKKRDPIRAQAVPIVELALQNGPYGKLDRWFWKKNYKARHLPEYWPDAKFENDLHRRIKSAPNTDIEVIQYTYWSEVKETFVMCAWTNIGKTMLEDTNQRTSPWITPRGIVVPGEAHGRGLAHLGLPGVKTVNEARKLALKAAAFALLGIWIRRDDRVFNPATAKMKPGAMWKVASTGSAGIGPSIQRLDIPHQFDVSSIIINDERQDIRRVLLDDELPEVADRVRSPTEIAARGRRYDRNRGGSTVRMAHELIVPVAHRSIDVCEQLGLLPKQTQIDDVLTRCLVKSPAAAAQRAAKVERIVSYLQIIVGLFGPQAMMLAAEVETLIPELGRWMGVDEKWLRKKSGVQELKLMIAGLIAKMQAEAQGQQEAPAQAQQQMRPGLDMLVGGLV